jgi:hypothetical protein
MNPNSYFCEMVDQSFVPRLEKARPHPVPLPQERGKLSSDFRRQEAGRIAAGQLPFYQKRCHGTFEQHMNWRSQAR